MTKTRFTLIALSLVSTLFFACGGTPMDGNTAEEGAAVTADTTGTGSTTTRTGSIGALFTCSQGICICSIGSDCSRDLPASGKCTGPIVCGDFECACATVQ